MHGLENDIRDYLKEKTDSLDFVYKLSDIFNKYHAPLLKLHWEKNAIESKTFLSKSMYTINSLKYTTRINKYVTNSIAYWFESMIYMLLERNAFDSIALFSQCRNRSSTFQRISKLQYFHFSRADYYWRTKWIPRVGSRYSV